MRSAAGGFCVTEGVSEFWEVGCGKTKGLRGVKLLRTLDGTEEFFTLEEMRELGRRVGLIQGSSTAKDLLRML